MALRLPAVFLISLFLSPALSAQWRVQSFGAEKGLRGFYFSQVFTDRDNRLWAVSTEGLQRFDGSRFRNIDAHGQAEFLFQRKDGSLVYSTVNDLRELRLQNNRWTDSLLARYSLPQGHVRKMLEDASGRLWIASEQLSFTCYARGDTLLRNIPPDEVIRRLFTEIAGAYPGAGTGYCQLDEQTRTPVERWTFELLQGCADNHGNHWFASCDTLLVMMTPNGHILKRVNIHAFNPKAAISTGVVFDGRDGICMGTTTGLMYYDLNTGICSWPEWRDEHSRIMTHCCLFSVFMVSPGVIWCGGWRSILRIQPCTGIISLPVYDGHSDTPSNLRSVSIRGPDTIYGGAGNGSAYRFTRDGNGWKTTLLFTQPVMRANAVNVIFRDSRGNLWIGRNERLLCVNERTSAMRTYPPCWVWSIHEDAGGNLWFASSNGYLWRIAPGSDSCTALPLRPDSWFPVYGLLAEGSVLLLATNCGMHYFDLRTLKLDSGDARYDALVQLTDSCCWSISKGKSGCYYIGGQFDGVMRYNPATQRKERLTPEGITVYAAVVDSAEQCWAITEKGLMQINGNGLGPRFYDERDGLLSADISFVGIRLLPPGNVVVAGDNGLSIVNTGELFAQRRPLPLVIDHVDANGRILAEDLPNESTLQLSWRDQGINIHLCMPDGRFPDRYRYRYRVNNDSSWSAWSENPVLAFASFAPGSYRLSFEVQNIDGYRTPPTLMNIVVTPPFWQTRTFYSGVTMLAIVLVTFGTRWRIRLLRNRYRMEQTMLELENKALRAQMNPHFIFNSLHSIQEFILDHKSKEANLYLGKFSTMMRQILEYSRRNAILLEEEISFLGLYLELEQLRFENSFSFSIVVSEGLEKELLRIPPMMVQPIVENAVHHGLAGIHRPGRLTIRFAPQENGFACIVEDNGRGREKAKEHRRAPYHESIAIDNINERLLLLTKKKKNYAAPFVQFTDLFDDQHEPAGTRVTIFIPFK